MKRGASSTNQFKKRKRKRNGVSTSTSVLNLAGTPSGKPQLMHIWHSNIEDPCTTRQSTVPIPSEPQVEQAQAEEADAGEWEDVQDSMLVQSPAPARPKRKQGNDSVSPGLSDSDAYLFSYRQRWGRGSHVDR